MEKIVSKRRYKWLVLVASHGFTALVVWIICRQQPDDSTPFPGAKSLQNSESYAPLSPSLLSKAPAKEGEVDQVRARSNSEDEIAKVAEAVLTRTSFPFTMGFSSKVSPIVQQDFRLSDQEIDFVNHVISETVDELKLLEKTIAQRREGPEGEFVFLPAATELVAPIEEKLQESILNALGEPREGFSSHP